MTGIDIAERAPLRTQRRRPQAAAGPTADFSSTLAQFDSGLPCAPLAQPLREPRPDRPSAANPGRIETVPRRERRRSTK